MNTYNNPMFLVDFYKVSHIAQYPKDATLLYSNFTARSDKHYNKSKYYNGKIVFFGLQAFIKEILIDRFNNEFFFKPKKEVITEYQSILSSILHKQIDVSNIEKLHDLGYLPIEIKALQEGSEVNIKVPVLTIKNTHPEFFWVTNYIETMLSAELWKPITAATIARDYKKLVVDYANTTCDNHDHVNYQCHDFSCRGMSGMHDAANTTTGHLLYFSGSDTIVGNLRLREYYPSDLDDYEYSSAIRGTEHSVMCAGGKEHELETYKRLLQDKELNGTFSIVSDTWDLGNVLTNILPQCKDDMLHREGTTVIRPDCFTPDTFILTNNGWTLFTDLTYDDLVAQVLDDGTYEFVKPLEIINQQYKGPMLSFKDHHGKIDLIVTPNHRMVFQRINPYTGERVEHIVEAANVPGKNWFWKILRSAPAQDQNKTLSDFDRLRIAFQADGSYTKTANKIRFHICKQRKIDRLREIINKLQLEHVEYIISTGGIEFQITVDATEMCKYFHWVNTDKLCSSWCKAFIEELSNWDATIRNDNKIKFDTTYKDIVNVVELVAIGAGYGVYITKHVNNRKACFSDVYTAHILKNNELGWCSVKVSYIDNYDNTVHCVKVPSGKIIVKRNKGITVTGNSGSPVKIVCGDPTLPPSNPMHFGCLDLLWKEFGGSFNSKGYRVLDPSIGLVYGDGITMELAQEILETMKEQGYASSNIVLGIGSYTYQYLTRDTFGFAVKATYAEFGDVHRDIFKDPVTDDGTKKSAKGLLRVEKEGDDFVLYDQQTIEQEQTGELKRVFINGKLIRHYTIEDLRERVSVE